MLQVRVVTDAGLASHLDPTLLQPADGDTTALAQSPSPISLQGSAPPRDQDRSVLTVYVFIVSPYTKLIIQEKFQLNKHRLNIVLHVKLNN